MIEDDVPQQGELLLYRTEDGKAEVQLHAQNGSVWLAQKTLAELFATSKQNISLHIKNILEDGELAENSVVKEYLTTAADENSCRIGRLPVGDRACIPLSGQPQVERSQHSRLRPYGSQSLAQQPLLHRSIL